MTPKTIVLCFRLFACSILAANVLSRMPEQHVSQWTSLEFFGIFANVRMLFLFWEIFKSVGAVLFEEDYQVDSRTILVRPFVFIWLFGIVSRPGSDLFSTQTGLPAVMEALGWIYLLLCLAHGLCGGFYRSFQKLLGRFCILHFHVQRYRFNRRLDPKCRECRYFVGSNDLLCAVNPTKPKGLECPDFQQNSY